MGDMGRIEEAVATVIGSSFQYPFLFIGSGMSRRYLGAPDWVGLLRGVCSDVLGDEYAYAKFVSRARSSLGASTLDDAPPGLLPEVASLMEAEVNETLLTGAGFSSFRNVHSLELARGGLSPMKAFIAERLTAMEPEDSPELSILREAGVGKVSGIITTNYDLLCERVFPDFDVHVGERGMLFHDASYAQELYKIHGSVSDPGSMVLTAQDYRAFDEGKDYLAAKLLTIFLEYPVIFLGYSIQDENIKSMLASVARCVGQSHMNEVKNRLLFVRYSSGGGGAVGNVTFNFDGQSVVMTCIDTDDFSSIYRAIAGAKKTFPLRLVKELKGNVYNLASEIDPSSDVAISGLDSILSSPDAAKKVVIGVARFSGEIGVPLTPEDIFRDVLLDDLCIDPKAIVTHYLNAFARRLSKAIPVFKYANALGWTDLGPDVEAVITAKVSLESFRTNTLKEARRKHERTLRDAGALSVDGMISFYGEGLAYKKMGILNEDEIDADELGRYLIRLLDKGNKACLLKDTDFRKMIIIYDFMRYGNGRPEKRKSPDLHH